MQSIVTFTLNDQPQACRGIAASGVACCFGHEVVGNFFSAHINSSVSPFFFVCSIIFFFFVSFISLFWQLYYSVFQQESENVLIFGMIVILRLIQLCILYGGSCVYIPLRGRGNILIRRGIARHRFKIETFSFVGPRPGRCQQCLMHKEVLISSNLMFVHRC